MSEPSSPIFPPPYPVDDYPAVEILVVPRLRRRYWLHALLLIATVFTTLVVGAKLQYNFANNLPAFSADESTIPFFPLSWVLAQPSRLLLGIPFSATLMVILLAHEMGHFVYCVRYGVNATLPFFIPAPTLIGTLGAFIRIRSPIRSRQALFDIGIAGPIAGFVVAVAVLMFAMVISKPMPPGVAASDLWFDYPLIFRAVHEVMRAITGQSAAEFPSLAHLYLHPTAIAAWVGMFATSLNLLPGGQLDGGHIVFAIAPRLHKLVSILTMLGLVAMAAFGLWMGWAVWAVLIGVTGMRHPQVPPWPDLGPSRRLLALFGLMMLALTIVPQPFHGAAVSWK